MCRRELECGLGCDDRALFLRPRCASERLVLRRLASSLVFFLFAERARLRGPSRPATRPSLALLREEPCVWAVCESIVPFHDVNRQSVALSSENARLWLPSLRMCGARVVWWLTAWRPLVEALRALFCARAAPFRRGGLPRVVAMRAAECGRARACRSIHFVDCAACACRNAPPHRRGVCSSEKERARESFCGSRASA